MQKLYILLLVILQLSFSTPLQERKVHYKLGRGPVKTKTSEVRPKRQTPDVDTSDRIPNDIPLNGNQPAEPDAERQQFPDSFINEFLPTRSMVEERDLVTETIFLTSTTNLHKDSDLTPVNSEHFFNYTTFDSLNINDFNRTQISEHFSTLSNNLSDSVDTTLNSISFSEPNILNTTLSTTTEKQNISGLTTDFTDFVDPSSSSSSSVLPLIIDSTISAKITDDSFILSTVFNKNTFPSEFSSFPSSYVSNTFNKSQFSSTSNSVDIITMTTHKIPEMLTSLTSTYSSHIATDLHSPSTLSLNIIPNSSGLSSPTIYRQNSTDSSFSPSSTIQYSTLFDKGYDLSFFIPFTSPLIQDTSLPILTENTDFSFTEKSSTVPSTFVAQTTTEINQISSFFLTSVNPEESKTNFSVSINSGTLTSSLSPSDTSIISVIDESVLSSSTKSFISDFSVHNIDDLKTTKDSSDAITIIRPLSTLALSTEPEPTTISNEIIPEITTPTTNEEGNNEDSATMAPSPATSSTAGTTTSTTVDKEEIITAQPSPLTTILTTTNKETKDGEKESPQTPSPATVITSPSSEIPTTESEAQTVKVVGRPMYPFTNAAKENSSKLIDKANCIFGRGFYLELCNWKNLNLSLEKWTASKGQNYGWLGGPPIDHTSSSDDGGYAMYETSRLVDNQFAQTLAFDSAMLLSPILYRTEAVGLCIDFWYAMDGLSQDRLRILLRPPPAHLYAPGANSNITDIQLDTLFMNSDGRDDIVLWENKDTTNGEWINGQVVYAFNDRHLIIFEGLPLSLSDPNRAYRGYISLDDFQLKQATDCKPFCNFEGGFCSWTQDISDDFDWELSRGSVNPSTGPPMDRFSFSYGIKGGGYAYVDSNFPRRPRDKARLLSEVFAPPEPDQPLCMRFWTHMFGNGIGALRIKIAPNRGNEEIIWELRGEQGNNWYQGQVTIAAVSDFQIVIEAEIGDNDFGDIAIDEIALKENACPTSPQTATNFKGDCTFEVDECGWRNVEFRQRMDELDWERTIATENRVPAKDHTLKTSQGSFMSLPRTTVQRGERGWLMSPPIEPRNVDPNNPISVTVRNPENAICLSFWYFMYDPFMEATGPSLGSLRVMLMEQDQQGFQRLTPLWALRNSQGPNWHYGQLSIYTNRQFMVLFEGLWGNTRGSEFIALDDITFFAGGCTIQPPKAQTSFLDCDFTRDSCSYANGSAGIDRWYTTSLARRPSTLPDHTYGGPVGYLFFDVFNTQSNRPKITLISRVIEQGIDRQPVCLTFWFAPIGNDPDTTLKINRETVDFNTNEADGTRTGLTEMIWEVRARDVYEDRIEWMFGQVQVTTGTDYRISFVGEARKGGFALDDIQILPDQCLPRPLIIQNEGDRNLNINNN